MAGKIDARLKTLGIELPKASPPAATYLPFVKTGNLVFVSGQLPMRDGTLQSKGLVGYSVPLAEAHAAAKQCAINLIAQAKVACDGNLDRIKRVVKLTGFVASGPDFTDHPKVVNGASDTMVEVFGDAGHHARAAVGSSSLPLGATVEVEAIFEVS